MDVHASFTASNAPILCLVCTATACGSQLTATINVRLDTTLAEVRSLLVSLASGGNGGSVAVREPPTNITSQQAQRIISSPLHPFDFTETFSFVHGGGCRMYSRAQEARLHVEDVLPRYPRFGLPAGCAPSAPNAAAALVVGTRGSAGGGVCSSSCTQWVPDTAPPVAVVQYPPGSHASRTRDGQEGLQHHDGGVSEMSQVAPQKRFALAALFVAPGDRAEGGLRVERVVAERLQLQLTDPLRPLGGSGSGAGLFSASALAASYGRPFRVETWSAGVTRWNGNTEDLLGRTLLHDAVQVGNEAAVRFLLSQSYIFVDVQERQSGEAPLHAAVRGNYPTLVKLLLEEGGANPLLANGSGDTPLHLALQRRRAVIVGLLCGRLRALKVAPTALQDDAFRNNMGYTPAALFQLFSPSLIDLCRDGASLAAMKALAHHYFFDERNVTARDAMSGQCALHAAAASGNVDALRYIGEELNLFSVLLSPAAGGGSSTRHTPSSSLCRSLLHDFRRQNPLHVAAAAGEPACVQYLLQKLPLTCLAEADLNGNTPLLVAMKKRRWRVVELLLTQCPPGTLAANAQDRHGISALHIACGVGMTRVAAVLLNHHGAVADQNSLSVGASSAPALTSFSPSPPEVTTSPATATAAEMLWGPHWENTALVHHGAVRGRLRSLEAREAKRQEQLRHRQSLRPSGQGSASTSLTVQGPGGSRAPVAANTYADYTDPVAIVKAAPHYVYGGGRLGYTPLRCALLNAVCDGRTRAIPVELLRLLCEHGALHEGTAADTRDLLFFLLTHRTDANAEAMLSWVMQQCAAAVVVLLRRDNVLLCRFCALRDDVGVRWCVEAQWCDVHSRDTNPLVACAAAGDANAAAFLLQCAGADANVLPGSSSALGVALSARQVEVAQVLILSRAQLSAGDGSWSALEQATASNLESVVRGLLGMHTVDPLEVSRVLVHTLQRLLYAGPLQQREQTHLALYLARAYDPTRSDVHPTELLHLSAAVGCFEVTRALVDRLLALPTTIWAELLSTVPLPPSRPVALIEPTMVPLTIHAPRLLPNRVNGKAGLYHPPKPFYRRVVPAVREAAATTLLHRVKVRDVYSYAAAAQRTELVLALRCGLRLPPWPHTDLRGWTVTDYVMARATKARAPLLALFVATGIAPAARHGRRVLPTDDADLVRAVHEAQQERWAAAGAAASDAKEYPSPQLHFGVGGDDDGVDSSALGASRAAVAALKVTAATLTRLVQSKSERSLALVRDILDAFLAVHQLQDLRRVSCRWLDRVVLCCAEVGRLDVLTEMKEHYGIDLAQSGAACEGVAEGEEEKKWKVQQRVDSTRASSISPHPTPLLMAVQQRHMSVITYLLHAGCAVHARGCLTKAMAAHVPLKNSQTSFITPLALAAWRQDYVCVRLLLAASPPLRPEDTEEDAGHSVGDALRGLVVSARAGMSAEQQAALTDCVRALARAGHPLRFASTVRIAAAKGLFEVAEVLVECYGSAALLADLVVSAETLKDDDEDTDGDRKKKKEGADGVEDIFRRPHKHSHLTALAYFAATPRLVPVLRSLLVERVMDEFQLETWRLTSFSEQVQALHRCGGRRGVRLTSAAVDFALQKDCAEGAILLLSLGLICRGVLPAPRPRNAADRVGRTDASRLSSSASLSVRVAHVLRHWHRRSPFYQSYTVLHSAAELGHGDVIDALTAEVQGLHLPVPAGMSGSGGKDVMQSFALAVPTTTATVTAPSLYALAATHADGWTWLPFFERVELVLDPRSLYVAARDLFALIFSGFGVSHAMDQVCRRAAQHKLLGDVFNLFEAADVSGGANRSGGGGPAVDGGSVSAATPPPATRGSAVSAVFVARQLQAKPRSFFLAGGTYLLTSMTALTCAIAAGSFDWVQYLSVHGPPLVYHRAAAARVRTCAERIEAGRERRTLGVATASGAGRPQRPWRPRDSPFRRPRHRRHHCDAFLDSGASLYGSGDDVCRMDALTLCMTLLADAVLRRGDTGAVQTYEEMLRFLLAWPAATPRKETINMLAVAAASLRRWPLLQAIMQHADRLYVAGLMSNVDGLCSDQNKMSQGNASPPRYFFPLLPEEIPAVLAHVIGSVRHVMHAVAHWAPKDVLIEVARHCQRTDVEAAVDARGCTSAYHALHHRQPFAVETFAALRVPLGRLCRTRQQQTPLMVAGAHGRTVLVTALMRPERLNQQDREGRTALMLAASHGHKAAVEALLAANADVSLCDAYGRTAVMLAALHGYDDLAVQLVQHFSHPGDLLSSQTSVLHCAAVGGCWRTALAALKLAAPPQAIQQMTGSRGETAAALVLREDADGHTPLYLAHAFGSARVLRAFLQVLFRLCGDGDVRTLQSLLELHGGDGDTIAAARRLLRSDSTLERYGWLTGVLEINAALAERVRQTYANSPAAHGLHAGEMPYLPVSPSLRTAVSLLKWCVQTRNTVGLRVLADFNVADDCGVLHLAAANGSRNVVELLVELEMSDPSVPDPQTGRYAFEHAALYQHKECASYLLANTVIDLAGVLDAVMKETEGVNADVEVISAPDIAADTAGQGKVGSSDGSSVPPLSPVSVFHVMAGHCGGELLVQFVEQTLRNAARTYVVSPAAHPHDGEQSGTEVLSRMLYHAMQRPAGPSRLTPLEYAIAIGDPAAVLRTAQVLQRLQEAAGETPALTSLPMCFDTVQRMQPVKHDGRGGEQPEDEGVEEQKGGRSQLISATSPLTTNDAAASAVFVSSAFLHWVPALSPAIRTILFDIFGMWDAAKVAGFGAAPPSPPIPAPTDGHGGASGNAVGTSTQTQPPLVTAAREVGRLRFGDARLIGIAALHYDAYCAEVLYRFFNPDHEREVLRLLLQDFPFKIRYEPESFRQCNLTMQTQLLQWLGSSLILSTYDRPSPCGIPPESWAARGGAAAAAAASNTQKNDVASIEVQVVRHRNEQYVELSGAALSHSLYVSSAQHALVVPDVMASLPCALREHRERWKAELVRASEKATRLLQRQPHPVLQRSIVTVDWDLLWVPESVVSVSADVERHGGVFMRLHEAMRNFQDWVRGPLQSTLREVDAADLHAVVVGVRHGATHGLQVCFRYVEEKRAVTRFPGADARTSAMTFKGDVYPSCCIEFNEVTHTDVAYACQETLGRAVAGDVALVRVHHARDKFLRAARNAMAAPRGVVTSVSAVPDSIAAASASAATANKDAEALNESRVSNPAVAEPFLQFKLELEGATLDRMPVCALERLLLVEAVAAIDAVVSPRPPPLHLLEKADAKGVAESRRARRTANSYEVFHSAAIVSAALVRRLKAVLVLFTASREAMVKLSGDKLMLCFTQHEIPSRSDITAEVTRTLVQEECEVYRRRLAEVNDMMQQRLAAYLPQARLTIDLDAIEKLTNDKAHLLSAMRILVHQQSAWVLQRLIEGVSIGWDADLGAIVRRHVRQVSLTLEPGLSGSCYLSPDGIFVYYCPLLCLERQPPGVVTPTSLPSWQLLSAQHIASLLLLQLSVLEPQVSRFVDRKRSVACWTAARRLTRRVVPGSPVVMEVQTCNLLHEPLRRGGERLKIVGEVGEPTVRDLGKGRYRIRFAAPRRTGAHRLFILLHGQPIADSPLWYTVCPGHVDLAHTDVDSTFDAVVIDVPFTVLLRLHDAAGNRLYAAPPNFDVTTTFPPSLAQLESWSLQGPSTLAVTLRVLPSVATNTALAVPLTVSLKDDAATASTASEIITLPPFPCVDQDTYQHVCRVRQGLTLDHGSPTTRKAFSNNYPNTRPVPPAALQPSCLYFRRSMRRAMRRKLASEAASLGGALGFRYPRSAALKRLERPSVCNKASETDRGGEDASWWRTD
ncbi:putative ankyrin repeat protein [Leptomonas pyrrhocoris]|uniref:Putative ankyrin repeat protein n=1 Tax=Leptomonas pyrrhocoris TaxID=157538 RepID=A0A0M9GAM0_LEPPY|nr:putative ankyrin repeat protein [Leptomonas pyrrhocoris]KPA86136.1 putative ankyrin repeat protein [Leptomonas pyrrhocoris]|eukprot:XP_015664575.1 putative ankyrin repeat protein [Leptomonas pyrrhocoris]